MVNFCSYFRFVNLIKHTPEHFHCVQPWTTTATENSQLNIDILKLRDQAIMTIMIEFPLESF